MTDIRTLGKRLGQCLQQEVIVLGKITKKGSDGMSMELTTTDDVRVNVTLPEPLDNNVSGYIEIYGVVKSKSTILCKSFLHFPSNMTKDFDVNGYNTLVNMRYVINNQLEGAFHRV